MFEVSRLRAEKRRSPCPSILGSKARERHQDETKIKPKIKKRTHRPGYAIAIFSTRM